jgi:hypothetical protein
MTVLDRESAKPDDRVRAACVGLVAAPELPAQIAADLAEQLPELLDRHHDSRWRVALAEEPLLAGREGVEEILDAGRRARSTEGWDAAIGTVAGALGSKLDNVDEVHQATYGHNQCRRRAPSAQER